MKRIYYVAGPRLGGEEEGFDRGAFTSNRLSTRFLRAARLDELSEFWNKLKDETKLVGPRPLLVEYPPLDSERQARQGEPRPGIAGWMHVNGQNPLSW